MRTFNLLLPFLCGSAFAVDYKPLVPAVQMPDGAVFKTWSGTTVYSRSYHVNQQHPRASDENPGTEESPFKTINRAARILQPGQRVVIHSGVYREMVEPILGGESPERMIAYEAAPGEQVIIKGSRVLETTWERSREPRSKSGYSQRLWMARLPASLFPGEFRPFSTPNATNEEMDLMPWALPWKGRIPYTLPRGMLFEDGRRMAQLAAYEDLVRLPGSFWVAPDGGTLHIHSFGSGSPAGKLYEVSVEPHLFKPRSPALGFIRVSGLTFEHCANSFLRTGVGAVYTMGGHHWIIENNTVRQVNSVGIEIGFQIYESGDKRYRRRTDPDLGHHIVRGNRIHDCGTAGMRGLAVSHALVERNEITDCGWQDAEYHWETAGIKLLITTGTLVRDNHITRIEGGGGIWLDWNNRGSRVTGNVIHNVRTVQGAIFVEASQVPNLVDNNIIWEIDGQGIRAADTDNLTIAHNLFGRIQGDLVVAKVATDRSLGGRKLTSTANRFVNNLCIDVEKPVAFGDPSNVSASNVYAFTGSGPLPAFSQNEKQSVSMRASAPFDSKSLILTWSPSQPLPQVPLEKLCDRDFFGVERQGAVTVPGPAISFGHAGTFTLAPPIPRTSAEVP